MKDFSHDSIALVSLGCAKNAVDLQVLAGRLVERGARLVSEGERADTVIVNTCAFIASAREEAEAEIRRALELKQRGFYKKVVVTGCYPQRYPEAKARFPGVDDWAGVPKKWVEPPIPALRFTGQAFAYLKIAEGCAHRCAYCAIPLIRGRYRARPSESILREARALVESGCRELNVVAQDPLLWHERRPSGETWKIADLLRALDEIPGDFWVRVLYSYPSEVTEPFLSWLETSPHAVRYLDIPVQHTVPEVLAKMNRSGAVKASRELPFSLRKRFPDLTLRTTILTGFPGETDSRFKALLGDLKAMDFDYVGAFAYSPEKGTDGASLKGRPSRSVAQARAREVLALAKKNWTRKARALVGQTCRALVVAPRVARLASQAPDVDGVVFLAEDAPVASFITVRLVESCGFDFKGARVG